MTWYVSKRSERATAAPLQEGGGVSPRVPLVPVPHCEPHAKELSEGEEESNAAHELESSEHHLLDGLITGRAVAISRCVAATLLILRVGAASGDILTWGVGAVLRQVELLVLVAAASKPVLCIHLYRWSTFIPAFGSNQPLLVFIDGQAGTGHRELDDEDDEQHNHVEEQHHLVVLAGSNETHYGYEEEENGTRYDARHQRQRGDNWWHICCRCHTDHDKRHNDIQYVECQEAVFGACESPTHLGGGIRDERARESTYGSHHSQENTID